MTKPLKEIISYQPNSKLNQDQRMFQLRMFAEGYPIIKIRDEIKLKYNIDIRANAIYENCHAQKWQPYVNHFREEYLAKVKAVPIANKRIRIDDLEKDRLRLDRLINSCPEKTRADKNNLISLIGERRRLLVEAREEMEKKPHIFTNINALGMGDMSDEGLHQRKQELIAKFRKVDDRGASRVDPDSGGIESEGT